MEMHQIRYFLAVCENRNFTRAAQVSFVSQPSLTQAIHRLEDELGGPLFSRGRQGAEPTTLGRLVEANLRSIYETSLQAKEKAVRYQRLKKEPVRVGVMHSIGTHRINPFFARYQKESPRVELEVIVESDCELMEKMRNGELDCVVSAAPKSLDRNLFFETLYEEQYVVALGWGHELAKRKQLSLKELANEPYLDRLNCELREALKDKLEAEGLSLYAAYRSNREEWLLEMVRAKVGFAIVPEFSLPPSPDFVRVALTAPALSRGVGVIRPVRSGRQAGGKALVSHLVKFLKTSAPEK